MLADALHEQQELFDEIRSSLANNDPTLVALQLAHNEPILDDYETLLHNYANALSSNSPPHSHSVSAPEV